MSENFQKVKDYYDKGLWTKSQVSRAVGKRITAEEYKEITGDDYRVVGKSLEEIERYIV
ncbi:hypothetical protein SDC9_190323 [bioreactor metagenome]|uniref:XkdX family protein n=1 Tax=bioreactor metagenome TaxID=1076179 RepID=A0A645HUN4_9ZZZZ